MAESASWQNRTVACLCSRSAAAEAGPAGGAVAPGAASPGSTAVGPNSGATRDAPHAWQKRSASSAAAPQAGHATSKGSPQPTQNRAPGAFSRPQRAHRRAAAEGEPASAEPGRRWPAATRATRSSGASSSASARRRSVWKCGNRRAPRSRSAMPRALSPARSARASCVRPAEIRYPRSSAPKLPRRSAVIAPSRRRGRCREPTPEPHTRSAGLHR